MSAPTCAHMRRAPRGGTQTGTVGADVLTELRRYWVGPGSLAIVVIILDQITKSWIAQTLGPVQGTNRSLLYPWLDLIFVKNDGVAFGLFQNIPYFFTITSILISIGALSFYRKNLPNNRLWVQMSVGLIAGGAIGNIIDRLRYTYVIDFIRVRWFPGIFNLADSAITVGVIMLAGYLLIIGDESQANASSQQRGGELPNQEHCSSGETPR